MSKLGKLSVGGSTQGVPGPLRRAGRIALWAVIVLLLYRGTVSILKGESRPTLEPAQAGRVDDSLATAFAVRFARSYLANSSRTELGELLATGASLPGGGGPAPAASHVAQAEVAAIRSTGDRRAVVTVSCELLNGEVRFLVVPIVRDMAGGVAAVGAPAFVAAPGKGRTEAEQSQPIPGADAESIRELASRFVETYLSGASAADLEYLTSPGSALSPLGGFQPVGAVAVTQLGDELGRSRTILARVTVRGPNGGVYPLGYRLRLEKRDRWYVTAIEGAFQ